MKEQEKILQKLIDDGVINSLDGAKIEGFKLGWKYALKEDETTFETRMINYRFLSIIDEKMDELDLSKKDLAEAIGTSASYVTQLFRGDKILNLSTLAKLQNALNVKFKISDRNTKIQITKDEIDNL